MPDVTPRNALRTELYQAFGNRPRLIKAFEDMLLLTTQTIPGQINVAPVDSSTLVAGSVFQRRETALSPLQAADDAASRLLASQIFGG